MSRPLTIVVREDQALVREGVVRMLERAGLTIAGAADATDLLRPTRTHRPDVVITDIRMPPRLADDGLRAAIEIRATEPGIGAIVLSQYLEDRFVLELVGDRADGVGYLVFGRVRGTIAAKFGPDRLRSLDDHIPAVVTPRVERLTAPTRRRSAESPNTVGRSPTAGSRRWRRPRPACRPSGSFPGSSSRR